MLPKQEKTQQPCELISNSVTCSMILQLLKVIAIFLLRRDGLCHSLVFVDKIHTYPLTKNGREDKRSKESTYPTSDLKFRKTVSCFNQTDGKTVIKITVDLEANSIRSANLKSGRNATTNLGFFHCCYGETT